MMNISNSAEPHNKVFLLCFSDAKTLKYFSLDSRTGELRLLRPLDDSVKEDLVFLIKVGSLLSWSSRRSPSR